jgi:cytidyltransferase-like protein
MTSNGSGIVVTYGGFDDLRPIDFRLFDESAKLGKVYALIWSDAAIEKVTGKPPKFPQDERLYILEAIRYIHKAAIVNDVNPDALPASLKFKPAIWAVTEQNDNPAKKAYCKANRIKYQILKNDKLNRFPEYNPALVKNNSKRKKVIVTGCFDWFHSGHVRFFEEISQIGDLYVAVGSDKTIGELKGDGHPMFSQQERLFVCQSIRYVTQVLIGTGSGWLDAEPEIHRLKPDIYAVNEDGDRPEKRNFCNENRIEYVVLKRLPKPGLQRRESTILRGF